MTATGWELSRLTRRWAVVYAELGWQGVPLNWPTRTGCSCQRGDACGSPGKHPWVMWREAGGSTDPGQIDAWLSQRPLSGWGLLTGPERSGLFVIDVDPLHGGDESLAALEAAHGPLGETLTSTTGSGGRHLLFAHPGGRTRQSAGLLGPGIDTRDAGGLIVAPPSVHHSGQRYAWSNWGTPAAALPAWVQELLTPPPPPPPAPARPARLPTAGTSRAGRYAAAALALEVRRVASAAPGGRNHALYCASAGLGRLVGGGYLDARAVGHELLAAALAAGLGTAEAEDTIVSGLRAGARRPKETA